MSLLSLAGLLASPAPSAHSDDPPVSSDLQPPDTGCAPGSLPAPPPLGDPAEQEGTGCAPVVDLSAEQGNPAASVEAEGHFAASGEVSGQSDPPPDPGFFDAAVYYLEDTFPITYSSTFSAYMEVYPLYEAEEWVGHTNGYYITATNHTPKGPELAARYRIPAYGDGGGWLQLFDWSCSPEAPCENGSIDPRGVPNGFVKSWRLKEEPCWYMRLEDNTGHRVNYVYYRNSTWIIDPRDPPNDPPIWRNAVYIWNDCTLQFDLVYHHDYPANQIQCAYIYCNPGGWAGTVERWSGGGGTKPSSIVKQGFHHQRLEWDGNTSDLTASNSYFKDPSLDPAPYWWRYYLSPYDTYEVGTFLDDDGDDVPNAIDPDIDGDLIGNGTELLCGANDWQGIPADWHEGSFPEQIGGAFAGRDDDHDGLVDEALPGDTSALDCDGDKFTGAVERYVFSAGGSLVDDQARCAATATANDEPNDRWPVDFNDNRFVNTVDVGSFVGKLGQNVPPGSPRHDLNANGLINTVDVGKFIPHLGHSCTTPP